MVTNTSKSQADRGSVQHSLADRSTGAARPNLGLIAGIIMTAQADLVLGCLPNRLASAPGLHCVCAGMPRDVDKPPAPAILLVGWFCSDHGLCREGLRKRGLLVGRRADG